MAGAPSQLELFDPKPELTRLEGKPLPPSIIGDQRYAFIRPDAAVLGPRFKFAKHGRSGAQISDMLPHLAEIVDDVCLVRSVTTDQFNRKRLFLMKQRLFLPYWGCRIAARQPQCIGFSYSTSIKATWTL